MVSVTITFEIFKLRYYVYCALFDLSCKLLLSIYLISAMCYTYYSTYYSNIFCLIYYRVVVKINLYQCQCQCQRKMQLEQDLSKTKRRNRCHLRYTVVA